MAEDSLKWSPIIKIILTITQMKADAFTFNKFENLKDL